MFFKILVFTEIVEAKRETNRTYETLKVQSNSSTDEDEYDEDDYDERL